MRITIALDDASMMTSQEQEIADVKVEFLKNCGAECEFIEHDVRHLETMKRTAVLVTDFGGLGVGFGQGAERCGHELMKLINNRPSTLFVLWSKHTESWYKNAIYDAMPAGERDDADEPPNPQNVVTWDYSDEQFWVKVRAWLGMTAAPEETPELTALIEAQEEISLSHRRLRNKMLGCDEPEEEPEEELPEEPVEDVPDIDDVILMQEIEESAEELSRKRQKAEREALREKRRQEGTDNEFHANVPKEPDGGPTYGDIVGELRVPIRIEMRPGMSKGFMKFKFADCIVDVSNDGPDGKSIHVASIGGQMGGSYEASFDEVKGERPRMSYMLATQDLWKAWEAFHEQYTKEHPELMTYEEQGFSGAVKVL